MEERIDLESILKPYFDEIIKQTEINKYDCSIKIIPKKYKKNSLENITVAIDFPVPSSERPNKRSKILKFKYLFECAQDYEDIRDIPGIEKNILTTINNFDFHNNTLSANEPQPISCYIINNCGKISPQKT